MALYEELPGIGHAYKGGKYLYDKGKSLAGQGAKALMGSADRQDLNRYDYDDQQRQLEIRQQQAQYAALLQAQMQGRGPSLLTPALAQAQRAGLATAASARGTNAALAGRSAGQMTARMGMGAAELRTKEQMAAQQQYAALLAGERQADLQARAMGVQLATAKLAGDTTTANANAERGQKGIGAIASFGGSMFTGSDPANKTDAAPLGSYQQPYGQPAIGPAPYGQPAYAQAGWGQGLSSAGFVLGGQPPPDYVNSGVDMKTNIEPIGGVNPRFSALTSYQAGIGPGAGARGLGFGANADAVTRPDTGTQHVPTQIVLDANQWFLDQKAAAQQRLNQTQAVSPTPVDTELAQGRSGFYTPVPLAEQQLKQQPAQSTSGGFGAGLEKAGAILGGGGLVGSDPVFKANEQQQPVGQLSALAAQAQPYKFRYKPEAAAAEGVSTDDRVGMMASKAPGSLAENPIYAPTVQTGPDGKDRVNAGQATLANIAVTSDIARKQQLESQRLDALEALALQGASGKGARGKAIDAQAVMAPRPEVAPPAGAAPTGQRFKALTEYGQASYGADSGACAPEPGAPPAASVLRGGLGTAMDNIGRRRLQKQVGASDTATDQDVRDTDAVLLEKAKRQNLRKQAESGAPQDANAYYEHLEQYKPTVTPGGTAEQQYRKELAQARGTAMETMLGSTAHLLQQVPAPASGFGAGAKEVRARRSRWIKEFASYARNASSDETAVGETVPRKLRPKDVAALLKQRGATVSEKEVQAAMQEDARGNRTYSL